MRVSGQRIKHVAKGGSLMQTAIFTKDSGATIRQTVLAHIFIITGLVMWVLGKTTNNMEKAMKVGLMDPTMKVNTRTGKNMVEAS